MTTVEGQVMDPAKAEPGVRYLGMYLNEAGWWMVAGQAYMTEAYALEDLKRWVVDRGQVAKRMLVVRVHLPEGVE